VIYKRIGFLFVFEYLAPVKVSAEQYPSIPKALKLGAYGDESQHDDSECTAMIEYLELQKSTIEDLYNQ